MRILHVMMVLVACISSRTIAAADRPTDLIESRVSPHAKWGCNRPVGKAEWLC